MRRISLAVALVVVSGAPLSAVDGAEGWLRQCSACHASASRVMRKVPPTGADIRADWMGCCHSDHDLPAPAERAAIVARLMEG